MGTSSTRQGVLAFIPTFYGAIEGSTVKLLRLYTAKTSLAGWSMDTDARNCGAEILLGATLLLRDIRI